MSEEGEERFFDRRSVVIDAEDLAEQRVAELEYYIYQLKEENEELKAKLAENKITPKDILGEFEYFQKLMPIRGSHFVTGQISASMIAHTPKVTINFPTPFPDEPEVFIFVFSVDGKSQKINPTEKKPVSFTVDFGKTAFGPSAIFWIAYTQIKIKSDFHKLVDMLKDTETPSQKKIESEVTKYVKKNGVMDEDIDGNTLLHHLVRIGNETLLQNAIQRGADVNALNKFRYSPLHTALAQSDINIDIVSILLNSPKINVTILNENMRTPLHYLCRNAKLDRSISILYRLLSDEKTAKELCMAVSKSGETALTTVCSTSAMNEEAIELLCKSGSNVNQVQNNGSFPLYEAIKKKKIKVAEKLLQYGADIDKEYKGVSVMKIAEDSGILSDLISLIEDRYALRVLSTQDIERMQNEFNSPAPMIESWTNNIAQSKVLLVNQATLPDYHIENFYTSCTHKHDILMNKNYHDPSLPIMYYQKYIKPHPHVSYCISRSDEKANVKENSILTIKEDSNDRKWILWTKRDTIRGTAEPGTTDLQLLKSKGLKGRQPNPLPKDLIEPELVRFENYFISDKYKFGVLYAQKGQTTEAEFFNNKDGSKHFEKFLELLGTKVRLSEHKGFAGGLDVKHDLTGKYSYVRQFSHGNTISIMYHVSTYLPWSESNKQQLDRKKHIGNDIVVLIFKEYEGSTENELIDLSSFKTQFNHAFIVVGYNLNQPESDTPHYSVNVMCKRDIPPFGPFITTDDFAHTALFSDFLVAKLINAEVASRESSQFRSKNVMIRGRLLDDMVKDSN